MIQKGAIVGNDCIVAAGAIVNKKFENNKCVLAGIPAKIVKENINWRGKRI